MHYDGPDRRHTFEHMARKPKIVHEVFADDLKPIHLRIVLHQVREMLVAQTNAQTKIR
jgi:hypothetical protein